MAIAAEYTTRILPLYGVLVIRDQHCDAEDEDDGQARRAAIDQIVTANRYQAFIHPAQDAAKVDIQLQLWDTPADTVPQREWEGHRGVDLYCPEGNLMIEVVTAGAVTLYPGSVHHVELPGGPGVFHLQVSFRERASTARERIAAAQAPDRAARLHALDGREQYLIQAWRTGPPPDDGD